MQIVLWLLNLKMVLKVFELFLDLKNSKTLQDRIRAWKTPSLRANLHKKMLKLFFFRPISLTITFYLRRKKIDLTGES